MSSRQSAVSKPVVSLIVAASENDVIGRDGDLPWRLPADLARFKRLTMGHAIVMGRKTYESIGRPLPGRLSIVLTRDATYDPGHAAVRRAADLDSALSQANASDAVSHDEVFVIGGGEVYRAALSLADRVYLTRVKTSVDGDATFPALDPTEWRRTESIDRAADEKNEHAVSFETWERAVSPPGGRP